MGMGGGGGGGGGHSHLKKAHTVTKRFILESTSPTRPVHKAIGQRGTRLWTGRKRVAVHGARVLLKPVQPKKTRPRRQTRKYQPTK